MPLRKEIAKAIEAILSFQNTDGGIPATSTEKPSGCWTSADTLEAIFVSGTYTKYGISRTKRIVNFLIESQIGSHDIQTNTTKARQNPKQGSWSLYQGQEPSTMASGHAVASLHLASKFFEDDSEFQEKIIKAAKAGLEWVEKNQNSDGSWGTQPHSGNSGKNGSVIAILYALLPYKYLGNTMHTSNTVRKAVEYLRTKQLSDGSWGMANSKKGDPSNTARAISCLIRADYEDRSCINKAISFLLNNQIPKIGLWEIEAERFDFEKAPAQVIFNDNTNCDVMVALMEADYYGKESVELLKWLLSSQKDDGLWYLSSPTKSIDEICTWSTAEWVIAIDIASKKLIGCKSRIFEKEKFSWNLVVIPLLLLIVLINTCYTYREIIGNWWNNLSQKTQDNLTWVVFIGLVVAVIGAAIWDWVKNGYLTYKNKIKNWYQSRNRKKEKQ